MANIVAIDTYRYPINFPVELAGKVRTYIKGKMKPAPQLGEGKKIRKPLKAMTPSDYVVEVVERSLADFQMDAESRKWVDAIMARNLKYRAKYRQLALERRKDPADYLKSGPKPGKKYPKFLAAMKKLAEKRRAEGWPRGKNKKNRGKGAK